MRRDRKLTQGELGDAAAGGFAALALCLLALVVVGFLGRSVAGQTLLANLRVHLALGSALLWLGVAAVGWRRIGALGAAMALASMAVTVAEARWTPVAAATGAAGRIDVLGFNMLFNNPDPAAVAAWLAREGPPLAVILEADALAPHLGALAVAYPYKLGCDAIDCDLLVLSRTPLAQTRILDLPRESRRLIVARLDVGGAPLWLYATHWSRGFFGGASEQMWAVNREIRSRRGDGAPYVVMGDFNATPWDPILQRLGRHAGLRHPAAWLPSWPASLGWFGFPIDHVLVSTGLRVERIEHSASFGSNHRGLTASLALDAPAAGLRTADPDQ